MPTTFTLAAPSAPRPLPARPKSPLAVLGKRWKDYSSPGVYEVVKAVTDDGEWLFVRAADGTWSTGHLPTETVVRTGLRTLRACRLYAGSGKAVADLKDIQAATEEEKQMAVKASEAVFVGTVTDVLGEELSVYRTPNGGALAYGDRGMRLGFGPEQVAGLREVLDRVAMPGQVSS
jgi:hypothetical protein